MTAKHNLFRRPRHEAHRHKGARRGFTLVEMLLAVTILGSGLVALLIGASRCIAVMRMARDYQTAQWVLTQGEAVHFSVATNSIEDLEVHGDSGLVEGFTFSRHVEPDDNADGLCVVRTRVSWHERGREIVEEVAGFVHDPKYVAKTR
jgi:prepilin-type N-terminal cleavage/methylation domain-containing protein